MPANVQLYAGAALLMIAVLCGLWFLVGKRLFGEKDTGEEAGEVVDGAAVKNAMEAVKAPDGPNVVNRTRGQLADATGKRIEGLQFGKKLSRKLEQAGSKLRPGEYVLAVGGVFVAIVLIAFVFRGPIAAGPAAFLVLFGARFKLNRTRSKRQGAFADQLPDLLQMLATNLRAGQSLTQAVNSVAAEANSPTKEELQRVVIEQRIGRDLTAAFKDLSDRMDSQDFQWVVSAIDINRTVGGDLATILGRVEATIRARNKIRGQVAAMSAEGKLTGGVLMALPPGIMLVVQLLNPGYLNPLLTTMLGKGMIGVSILMLAVGAFWLKKISEFTF